MTEPIDESNVIATRPDARALRGLFAVAVGFGLVVGWLDLGVMLAQRALVSRISMNSLRTNRHTLWMTPVSGLMLFVAVGLVVVLLARFRPGVARWLAWRLFVAFAALTLLFRIEGLNALENLLLACGLASRVGPFLERRASPIRRLARIGLPVLAGGLVVLIGLDYTRVVTAEQRALSQLPPASPSAPNVLLLVLDNVRAESMSLHGYNRATTPNLDRLAHRAIRFTRARSTAPWTLPSHASMFTGQWPHKLSVSWDHGLDETYPTLAESLARHGYATAGFVGNTYYCNARYGLDRGFARYEVYYEDQAVSPYEVICASGLGRRVLRALGFQLKFEDGGLGRRKTAEMLNRDVLGWLDNRPRDRPFFVFLNLFDAHDPFIPPRGPDPRFGLCALPESEKVEILKRDLRLSSGKHRPGDGPPDRIEREAAAVYRDSYESCIAYLDRQVGLLFDELDRRGLRENTLIVVTSDHGEHFREHGFLGHGLSLYRREVHVPLLVFPIDPATTDRTVSEPVSIRDIPATVVGLTGLGDRVSFPGQSLARFWRAPTSEGPSPNAVLTEVGHQKRISPLSNIPASRGPVQSLVTGNNVYIKNGDGREELYDVQTDPLEMQNLADKADVHPPIGHFRTMLNRLLNDPGSPPNQALAGRDAPDRDEDR